MPAPQITNPYGAMGVPGAGTGAAFEGTLTLEAQSRSTALNSNSAGSTDGNFRTILAGMVVTPTLATSSFYPAGVVVDASTGLAQFALGIAAENIQAYWGTTGSTGAERRTSPNDQSGSIVTYGVTYAMFASTQHPGAGDKGVPAFVTIATTSDSLFNASCHWGLCALSTLGISASVFPTTSAGPSNIVGIAFTSKGGINAIAGLSTGPQLYPIMVRPGG